MAPENDENKSDQGKLTIVLQAAAPGIWPGPYQIDIVKPGEPVVSRPIATVSKSVLGSPSSFSLPAGTYQIVISHPEEGTFRAETTVAQGQETATTVRLGHPLARGYRALMLETRGREQQFEAFLLNLGKNPQLQAVFQEDPDGTLQDSGVLIKSERLSRNNRLFIALLANKAFRQLIRGGPAKTVVPDEYRRIHRDRMRRLVAKVLPTDCYIDDKVIEHAIQQRFYFQSVLEATLSNPVIEKIYGVSIDMEEIRGLFDDLYGFADDPDLRDIVVGTDFEVAVMPGSVVLLDAGVAGGTGDVMGTGIYYVFTPASQSSDISYGFGFGVTQEAAIFQDSYIVSKASVFTKTKVFCDLRPHPDVEPGLADQFELLDDFTVTPEFADTFNLEDFQANEVYNISLIADAVIEGMNIINYKGALDAAKQHLLTRRHNG